MLWKSRSYLTAGEISNVNKKHNVKLIPKKGKLFAQRNENMSP